CVAAFRTSSTLSRHPAANAFICETACTIALPVLFSADGSECQLLPPSCQTTLPAVSVIAQIVARWPSQAMVPSGFCTATALLAGAALAPVIASAAWVGPAGSGLIAEEGLNAAA